MDQEHVIDGKEVVCRSCDNSNENHPKVFLKNNRTRDLNGQQLYDYLSDKRGQTITQCP